MRSVILVVFLLLGMVQGVVVDAVMNHGLYWEIEVGDEFAYNFALLRSIPDANQYIDYYVVVDSLPIIPDNVTENPGLRGTAAGWEWNIYFSFYFMNDTEITSSLSFWSAFPLGNWTLIEEFERAELNTSYWDIEIIDTDAEWGMSISADERIAMHTDTVKYSKVDGVLNLFEMHWQYYDGGYRTFRATRSDGGFDAILVVGAAAVIGFAVVVVVVIKKRSVR
ncbi:MAG: hypothetical protein ACXAB0_11925 [Candidatus Thorarchaeota archaeon]|jgi:hypothetical protein